MTDRIKLTADDFQIKDLGEDFFHTYARIEISKKITIREARQLKKQILENQEFSERILAIMPNLKVDKLQTLLETAEKYDACSNFINQTNELLQENKQCKKKIIELQGQSIGDDAYVQILEEKLEKIEKFVKEHPRTLTIKGFKESFGDKK